MLGRLQHALLLLFDQAEVVPVEQRTRGKQISRVIVLSATPGTWSQASAQFSSYTGRMILTGQQCQLFGIADWGSIGTVSQLKQVVQFRDGGANASVQNQRTPVVGRVLGNAAAGAQVGGQSTGDIDVAGLVSPWPPPRIESGPPRSDQLQFAQQSEQLMGLDFPDQSSGVGRHALFFLVGRTFGEIGQ